MDRVRTLCRQRAVAHAGGQGEHRQGHGQSEQARRTHQRGNPRRGQPDSLQVEQDPRHPTPGAPEGQHEGQDVNRQRDDPEQRRGRDIGRDIRGHRQHQAGWHEGQGHPAQLRLRRQRPRLRRARCRRGRLGVTLPYRPQKIRQHPAPDHRRRANGKDGRPEQRLRVKAQQRLGQGRVAQQGDQAAGIARRVEEVRVLRTVMGTLAEPMLQQWRGRGNGQKRWADGDGQMCQQPQRRHRIRPGHRVADRERHERQPRRQHAGMNDHLCPRPQAHRRPIGIRVAEQQYRLEETHAGVPHSRRAAQSRQHHA